MNTFIAAAAVTDASPPCETNVNFFRSKAYLKRGLEILIALDQANDHGAIVVSTHIHIEHNVGG